MSFLLIMKKYKKFFSHIFLFTLLVSSFYFLTPKKTLAFWPTFDVGGVVQQTTTAISTAGVIAPVTAATAPVTAVTNVAQTTLQGADHLKKFVLDPIAYGIAKMIIKQLTAQTVNWINSGFKGNPAFVTDPSQFFLNVGDTVAAAALSGSALKNLCQPFQAKVRLALAQNYLQETGPQNYSCTLGALENNFDNFTKDFTQGGWDGWFSMTQNQTNKQPIWSIHGRQR